MEDDPTREFRERLAAQREELASAPPPTAEELAEVERRAAGTNFSKLMRAHTKSPARIELPSSRAGRLRSVPGRA
jgi:hypothetical protein